MNVLVALFDPDHIHHELAHDWFTDHRSGGWATCAMTENGFVRVLSSPRYSATIRRPLDLVDSLRAFCGSGHHVFWTDAVSIRDKTLFNPSLVRGPGQITDVYLLGLSRKMGGSLTTFDRTIPLAGVVGAVRENLTIISPPDE